MKLKTIASLCKSNKQVIVKNVVSHEGEIRQWVGISSALYRLEGLPYLDKTAIFKVFDIPTDKAEDFAYCEDTIENDTEMAAFFVDFAEGDAEDLNHVSRAPIDIQTAGESYILYFFHGQFIFIPEEVLSPVLSMDLRSFVFRKGAIVIKEGLVAQALIFPTPVWHDQKLRDGLLEIYNFLAAEYNEKKQSSHAESIKVLNLFNRVMDLPPEQQSVVFDALGIPDGEQEE